MLRARFHRPHRLLATAVLIALVVAACSDDTSTDDSAAADTTTSTTAESTTTTTEDPVTTTASTTTTEAEPVPDASETVLVHGEEVRSNVNRSTGTETDGVTLLTLEYVDTIEMSDPRASGTAEWTATLYSPDGNDLGGTWTSEDATLTNDGGTWVGYRTGTYGFTRNMPGAVSTDLSVKTGEIHYIGQGGYEGLRMDLYTSSDGIIGTIRPVDEPAPTTITPPPTDIAATSDTVMVHGPWGGGERQETDNGSADGVTFVVYEYNGVLEMSDPRASGTIQFTSTLFNPDSNIGGPWFAEGVAIVNDDGEWTGDAVGVYIFTDNMPSSLTSDDTVSIGEWHLIGTGAYDGLRMDLYTSSDGVIGSIRPVE